MVESILDSICSELVKVMGPVAPMVMAEKIKGLGVEAGRFPMEKVAQLVETISYEIQDNESRAEFQKAALKQLKHAGTHTEV